MWGLGAEVLFVMASVISLNSEADPFGPLSSARTAKSAFRAPAREWRVVLAGNPNCGKSTLFNLLTGGRQHIGNYPGVTVEKKEGLLLFQEERFSIVDLPGTYSLSAAAPDEAAARDFLLFEKIDLIVNVVNAAQLERGLVLTFELLELGLPLLLVLNMVDEAERQGRRIDQERLTGLLQTPVVATVARSGVGRAELLKALAENCRQASAGKANPFTYGAEIEAEIENLSALLESSEGHTPPSRWLAVKLLEGDTKVAELVLASRSSGRRIVNTAQRAGETLSKSLRRDPVLALIEARYGLSQGLCREVVGTSAAARRRISEKIDVVLTHRWFGLPIFLLLMYLLFFIVFSCGAQTSVWLGGLVDKIGWQLRRSLGDGQLSSLLVDGILAGCGNVLVFMPSIFSLFFLLAWLEDSGYMSRAAFLMDRVMRTFGLDGKSFIPLMIGLGCSVPAIMATRTQENARHRLITILVLPLISCGGRLPIYTLLIAAFFPGSWQAPLLLLVYLTGFGLLAGCARLFQGCLGPQKAPPMIMELPPYRMPTWSGLGLHVWERGRHYLKRAGLLIFFLSIVFWALISYPRAPQNFLERFSAEARREAAVSWTWAGRLGHFLEPLGRPLGFDWRLTTALLGAGVAKEMLIAQIGIILTETEVTGAAEKQAGLRTVLRARYSPRSGLSMIIFSLIGLPCFATLAATYQETGSWRWPLLQFFGLTALAWLISCGVYQGGLVLTSLMGR